MNNKLPAFLLPGNTIGIVAPARKVKPEDIQDCIETLQHWGYRVKVGEHIYGEHFQMSGTDSERAIDLENMILDNEVKAIICAKGGYGSIRMVDQVNWEKFLDNPKWFIGFSDPTVIHGLINNTNCASIHGPMAVNFTIDPAGFYAVTSETLQSLKDLLEGRKYTYNWQTDFFKPGSVKGQLIGGNISVLHSMGGTNFFPNTGGSILFLEDLDEHHYHLDRMMQWMKKSGLLSNLAGLVVGGLDKMKNLDPANSFGMTAKEIVMDAVIGQNYPVGFDFQAGHSRVNMAMLFGAWHRLEVDDEGRSILKLS